ncbi:MAG: outer membrane protein assembly factor BamB [Planctomycetota bacterium]|jgi:outer membrane protein assembly factor BamB
MSNANNPPQLSLAELIFVSCNSRAAALSRQTGEIVWSWKAAKGSGFVALLLDGDRLIASVNGYTYCLDAQTGEQLWMNPLTGYGVGVPCLTSVRGTSLGSSVLVV